MKKPSNKYLPLFILFAMASMLRCYGLGRESLWVDEGFSYYVVSETVGGVISRTSADLHPPFYYLLLHGWCRIFGYSEYSLRLPSVLLGVAGVFLVYLLGKTLHTRKTGLLAASLTAISPFLIHYSQEARMYQLLLVLTLFSTLCLHKYFSAGRKIHLSGYIISSVLALYTHYFAGLLLFSHLLCGLFFLITGRAEKKTIIHFILALVLIGTCFLPWVPVLGEQASHPARMLPVAGWSHFLTYSVGGFIKNLHFFHGSGNLYSLLIHCAFFVPFIYGLIKWRNASSCSSLTPCAFFFPVLIPLFLTFNYNWFSSKFLIFVFPFYYLIVAFGIRQLPGFLRWIFPFILGISFGFMMSDFYGTPRKEEFRDAVHHVLQNADPDDVMCVHSPYIRGVTDFYLQGKIPLHTLEETTPEKIKVRIQNLIRDHENIWLMVSYSNIPQLYRKLIYSPLLQEKYGIYADLSFRKNFLGVRLYRFSRKEISSCTVQQGAACKIPFSDDDNLLFTDAGRLTIAFQVDSAEYHVSADGPGGAVSSEIPLSFYLDGKRIRSEWNAVNNLLSISSFQLDSGNHYLTIRIGDESKPVLHKPKLPAAKPSPARPSEEKIQAGIQNGVVTVTRGIHMWRFGSLLIQRGIQKNIRID